MNSDSRLILDNANWPVLLLGETGTIVQANRAAASQIPGLESGKTSIAGSLWSEENQMTSTQFLQTVHRSEHLSLTVYLRLAGGQSSVFRAAACLVGEPGNRGILLQLFPDDQVRQSPIGEADKPLSAAKSAALSAEAAAHKQKLDCALQLTRTVALDFNNALTSILGHTSLLLGKIEAGHPWRSSLVEVEKSAEKAAEIAHDLAAFSRQEKDTRSQVAGNLNDLLRRTVELFQSPVVKPVKWSFQFESRLYTVNFDEAKMQQAFIKILDNAVQALSTDGKISIRTRNEEIATQRQEGTIRVEPGSYVCVYIEDNGCGISADVLPRIFEPFFTTKNSPTHRGLGLAWVYGIITNHGGSVAVASARNAGTVVKIYLPAQKKFVRDRTLKNDDLRGTETILMIDDEDMLLTMGETVLSSFGYRVMTANSGAKALEIFAKGSNHIDLVVTDLVMPQMSGRELIQRLRTLSPQVKILCTSGFMRATSADEEEYYLQKPFTSQDLLRKVKQTLSPPDAT